MTRTPKPFYAELSSLLQAKRNCEKSNNTEWRDKHQESIDILCQLLPSGSGIDTGTSFDQDDSTADKLVFTFSYHHMDEHGGYDGWTDHKVIVTPSLAFGIDIKITGRNRNDIKDYLHDVFAHVLTCQVWQDDQANWHSSIYDQLPTAN